MNLSELTIPELLKLQSSAVEELRVRGVVRTANNPVGDYTEWLVAKAFGLKLVGNSFSGYDAISPSGVRVQIKGRRVTTRNPSRQLSAIRKLAEQDFDELFAVIFNEAFEVVEAVSIPHALVGEYGTYQKHVNAHILFVQGRLLEDPRVKSLHIEMNAANNSLQADVPDGLPPELRR